jgi:hypothetical protein
MFYITPFSRVSSIDYIYFINEVGLSWVGASKGGLDIGISSLLDTSCILIPISNTRLIWLRLHHSPFVFKIISRNYAIFQQNIL